MPLAKCARCNKLFDKVNVLVCPACEPAEDADYEAIRAVLSESANLNAEQLSSRSGVAVAVVMRMIEEGRLSNATLEDIKCGRCGASAISASKKLCQACLEELNAQIAAAQMKVILPEKKTTAIDEYSTVRKLLQEKRRTQ